MDQGELKTAKQLAKAMCQREGGKVQVNVAQMTEIIGLLSELCYFDSGVVSILIRNGENRLKKKKK